MPISFSISIFFFLSNMGASHHLTVGACHTHVSVTSFPVRSIHARPLLYVPHFLPRPTLHTTSRIYHGPMCVPHWGQEVLVVT